NTANKNRRRYILMAKQGSIQHYRQTGEKPAPQNLPFGEIAISKDGTIYAGNAETAPIMCIMAQKYTTLNVSLSGSDTLGDGSAAKPYKTIQKAVDSLSKYLIGDVTIKVADGVYNENVSVKGFVGIGALNIKSTAGDSVNPNDYDRCKLKWLNVVSCSARVLVLGFTLTTLNSTGWWGSLATILNCQHVTLRIKATANTMGGDITLSAVNIQDSSVMLSEGTLIQNQRRGIYANQNSRVFIMKAVVNNCTDALCSEASIISLGWDSQVTGTLIKSDGGLITYGGGQFK
ncbi:MAG: hypothetical protein RR087_11085, partial [Oscillospiraceae bacterium]